MVEIEVSLVVLERLKVDFPKANSAQKALAKYVAILSDQINRSIIGGLSTKGFHSISMKKQRARSQLGPAKLRLQNWLERNDLQLFKVIEEGSNFSNRNSLIKLSNLARLKQTVALHGTRGAPTATVSDGDDLKEHLMDSERQIERLYPGIFDLDEQALNSMYDYVPVDMVSLENYTHWLMNDAALISTQKKLQYLEQADTILRVARYTGGKYLQRKKLSEFGRNYYEGLSVQNVNRQLRRAMLGHCWEYDIRSAVFAFKMGFAADVCAESGSRVADTFKATLSYLQDKKDFMLTLRHSTFGTDKALERSEQEKLLKQAITAIGFGARATSHGWKSVDGCWNNPALNEIFKYEPDTRQRFLNCETVRQFIGEQKILDSQIYKVCEDEMPGILMLDSIKTQSGRTSKAKVIAWLYQHYETEVMNVVSEAIRQRGRQVLARVHDAIFIDKRLGVDNMYEVSEAMKAASGNSYWRLAATEIEAWGRPSSLLSADQATQEEDDRHERLDLMRFAVQHHQHD